MTFSGTPDTDFKYNQAFSFLCESRKLQFVKFLKETGNLPIYYPGDVDVYMRAGYLNDNSLMVALFNICLDPIDEISLICDKKINKIEKLTSEGKRITCDFYEQDGVIYVKEPLNTLAPVVLFIS